MSTLTDRQSEMLALAADGMTARQIAEELGLDAGTVANYIASARRRVGAHTRAGLLVAAIERGVIAIPPASRAGVPPLSPRQRLALDAIREGLTARELSERLGISYDSTRTLLSRAYRKIGARSRTHAIARCYQLGIFKTGEQ